MKEKAALLLIIFFLSCNTKTSDEKFLFWDKPKTHEKLIGKQILIATQFYKPWELFKLDSLIFINDHVRENGMLSIYNTKSKIYYGDFFEQGQGLGQLMFASKILKTNQKNNLYILNPDERRVLSFRIDSLLNDSSYIPRYRYKIIGFNEAYPIQMANVLDSSYLALVLPSLEGRLALVNKGLHLEMPFGVDHPLENKMGLSEIAHNVNGVSNFYSAEIAYNKLYDKVIVTHKKVNIIDIYSLSQRTLIRSLVGAKTEYPPESITASNGTATPCHQCERGNSSPNTTDKYFFVLRKHKLWEDPDGWVSNLIYQFDYDGNIIKALELDQEISDFVIDEKAGKIYGVSPFSDQPLFEYNYSFN